MTSMEADSKSCESSEGDILEEVGYYELLKQREIILEGNPDLFSKIQSVANECNSLQQSIRSLEKELLVARKEVAAMNKIDAAEQKESDDQMEIIRGMEDQVASTENISIPQEMQRKADLDANNRRLELLIQDGPGWSSEQQEERDTLNRKLERTQEEGAEANSKLTDLRLQVKEKELEVDASVNTRDKLNHILDNIETAIIKAKEELRTSKFAIEEAERNKETLKATVEQSNSELKDLIKERDEAKEIAESIVKERNMLNLKCTNVLDELGQLAEKSSNLMEELKATSAENREVKEKNEAMSNILELKRKEHQDVVEKRAKMAKLRALIEQKCDETDQQRKTLEKEKNAIHIETVQLETEIPMLVKDNEATERLTKRLLKEVELLNRKRETSCRGCHALDDLIKSHQSTLKRQENEILAIKRDIRQHELSQSRIDEEIIRDDGTLHKILLACKEKRILLNEMQECNRELEASIKAMEENADKQQERCEVQRQEHNKQTKALLELRTDINNSKQEYKVLFEQRKRLKEDIGGAENNVFGQHRYLHHINTEREGIERDVRAYVKQGSELNLKKEGLSIVIDKICREIDEMDKRLEEIRKQHSRNTSDKDIIGAQLVATNSEIDKVMQHMKPLQSALVLGSHKFECLRKELDEANEKTKQLVQEKAFIQRASERQKEQFEVLSKLEDDLAKQVSKNKMLTVELGRPINLHRWRKLQDNNPEKWAIIEKVHRLQKQVIISTDKLTSQSSILESKKKQLAKLQKEVSCQTSADEIRSQLSQMKASYHSLSKEIKTNELVLHQRAESAEAIKAEILELEKKRMEMKAAYIVSVIHNR